MYIYICICIYIHISDSRHLSSSLILSHSDFHRIFYPNGGIYFHLKRIISPRSVSRSSQTPGSAMSQDAGPNGREKAGGLFSNSGNLRNRFTQQWASVGPTGFPSSIFDVLWCSIWWSVSYFNVAPKKKYSSSDVCSLGPRWSDGPLVFVLFECAEAWIESPLSSTLRPRGPLLEPEPTGPDWANCQDPPNWSSLYIFSEP